MTEAKRLKEQEAEESIAKSYESSFDKKPYNEAHAAAYAATMIDHMIEQRRMREARQRVVA